MPSVGQLGYPLFDSTVIAAYVNDIRDELLALALPSLTLLTGGELGEDIKTRFGQGYFVNMNDPSKKNGWPATRGLDINWKHSDMKDVSFVFSKEVFKLIVENGGL